MLTLADPGRLTRTGDLQVVGSTRNEVATRRFQSAPAVGVPPLTCANAADVTQIKIPWAGLLHG
jgi:hypothetical protein